MTHTPADELRAAAAKLRDDRNCDGYTVDCNSLELLRMIRILLNSRLAIAGWLESFDGIDLTEHGAMSEEITHALAVSRAMNGQTKPARAGAGRIVDHLLGGPS